MLDFSSDSSTEINVFTNVQWIKEKYNGSYFKFLEDPEGCDICIVNSGYELMNAQCLRINIDRYEDGADVLIPECYMEAYLDLLQKFNPDICGIGMADIMDVMNASRGSLVEYMKMDIVSDNEIEHIDEFRKILKGGACSGSAVLFVSQKDYEKLNNFSGALEELYENLEIIMFTPSGKDYKLDNHVEVFVFKR